MGLALAGAALPGPGEPTSLPAPRGACCQGPRRRSFPPRRGAASRSLSLTAGPVFGALQEVGSQGRVKGKLSVT